MIFEKIFRKMKTASKMRVYNYEFVSNIIKERNILSEQVAQFQDRSRRKEFIVNYETNENTNDIFSLSEITNPLRYSDNEWLEIHNSLENYSIDKHCFIGMHGDVYRKGWEWTQCIYGLKKLGMLSPEKTAIGVGAGRECVIFYLADHIRHVTATDLYGAENWSSTGGKEADLALIERAKAHCPATVDLSKISFENRDGTNLGYPDESFDFAWSLSSIEHFGGHEAARKALLEMARVVKPGGIIAVATEFLLLEEHRHPEYFTKTEIFKDLIYPCSDVMSIVGDINFNTIPYEYMIDSISVPNGVNRSRRHVILNDGNVQWTSIMLFFRKK